MTIIITKLTHMEQPEHWRLMVVCGVDELLHSSSTTRNGVLATLQQFLTDLQQGTL